MTRIEPLMKRWSPPVTTIALTLLLAFGAVGSSEPHEIHFTILHTNDEHSAVQPFPHVNYHPEHDDPTVGGFARLSRLVGDIRTAKDDAGEPVVLVSAGDIIGGSPYFWLIPGGESPEISLMQQIGYDVVTIGNHEFDYGPEILARYFRAAGYPEAHAATALVSSNILVPGEHPLAACEILDTHIVVLENGLRLGFFGLLGANAARLAAKTAPLEILDPIAAATAAVRQLRDDNADVIIAVTHAGLVEDRAVATAVPGIDVMVTGHCHTALDTPLREGDTLLAQSGSTLRYLGVLELAYNSTNGRVRIRNEENNQPFLVPINDAIEKDPEISQVIASYTEKLNGLVSRLTQGAIAHVHDTVFSSSFVLKSGPPKQEVSLGNFVTDAIRLKVEKKTGEKVDFAIQANGVIRADVIPGSMPYSQDKISFHDLVTTIGLGMGYDDTPGYPLTSIYLTGNEIYRMFEVTLLLSEVYGDIFFLQVSGARFAYDPARTVLFRIPFTEIPVPSFRAVQGIEQFIGEGYQDDSDENYLPISRGDNTLYHVVCDYYILSFFPRVGALLPFYTVTPKDRHGNAIAIRDAIIHVDDEELKFWQVVTAYALSHPPGDDGIPRVPEYYAQTGSRIMQQKAYSLMLWAFVALTFLL